MATRDRDRKPAKRPAVMAAGSVNPAVDEHTTGPELGADSAPQSQDEVQLVRRASEVLGASHVARWMQSEIPSLGNQTPYVLMQTEAGRRKVELVLLKIEHGVY